MHTSNHLLSFLLGALLLLCLASPAHAETRWHWQNGTIVVDTPPMPAGQQTALNLTTPKLPVIRIAFVGLGMRGVDAVKRWTYIPGVRIVALCDYEPDRAQRSQETLRKAGLPDAALYTGAEGYKELCARKDINLVYIATDWQHHVPVAKCALEHGHNVAIEVPSAMNLDDCWDLINLAEQKRLHCQLLENCCYDFFELNTLNMAQHGVFGDILHVEGAYIHDLSPYWKKYWKNWRLEYNQAHRGDVYPTHGLGPVAQLLNLHRGDRIKTLVAMDTKAASGPMWVKEVTGKQIDESQFRNGDHPTTLTRTEGRRVIEIPYDVMNQPPYNRKYQLTGTKGFANKYPVSGYAVGADQLKLSGVAVKEDNISSHTFLNDAARAQLEATYKAPLLSIYEKKAKEVGGHGGMDFIMDSRLAYCLQNGLPLDIDVYDLAEWCSLAELGELSMDHGNASVQVPDFTRGHWRDIQGFHHAFATAAEERQAAALATGYTAQLKSKGADAAEKWLKKQLKAQAKKR